MSHIFTKTAKGLREATGKTHDLPTNRLELLKACKGQFAIEEIVASALDSDREWVSTTIVELIEQGYLREIYELSTDDDAEELDFLAETSAADEASEKLRAEIAARRGQRGQTQEASDNETDDEAHLLAVERIKRDVEDKARREADARARQEAEERERAAAEAARHEAEEKARREAEEKARRAAEVQAILAAQEKAKHEAEEKVRLEAEEKQRRQAEKKARQEAEEAARRKVEEKLRRREEETQRDIARQKAKAQRKVMINQLIVPVLSGFVLLLIGGLAALHLSSFDSVRNKFEQLAGETLGLTVKAENAHFALYPTPQWMLNKVVIGSGDETVTVDRVVMPTSLASLWGMPKEMAVVHLNTVRLPAAVALKALQTAKGNKLPQSAQIMATDVEVATARQTMPKMAVEAQITQGELSSFTAKGSSETTGKISLEAQRSESNLWQIRASAQKFTIPLGADLLLNDFALAAQLGADVLTINEFSGRAFEGDIKGNGTLSWQGPWRLDGIIQGKIIDAARLAPAWAKDGYITGNGVLSAEAESSDQLYPHARVEASFSLGNGMLKGVDLERVIQGRGLGEETRFEALEGLLRIQNQQVELSALKLRAGAISAKGALSIAPDRNVRGRIGIEIKATTTRLGAGVTITGTVAAPQFQR